jgi:glycosidase
MVKIAHSKGMYVILDWVANHTAWDNQWITDHPDWYTHDASGKIIPPVADWSDVAELNYNNKEMRDAMIDAMKFWVNCWINPIKLRDKI